MNQQQNLSDKLTLNGKSLLLSILVLISGCSGLVSHKTGSNTTSSSLVSFLYPEKQTQVAQVKLIPQLTLPVKIGLAFLPSKNWRNTALDSSTEYQLLTKVKSRFSQYPFIDDIQIFPSTYLRHSSVKNGTGFDTLSQVARLHNVDLIALVSYDQLTQSQHNNASLLYWTIVGMYVIPGNENTIQTFVDTAVFDVRSRQLLMRAPGISKLQRRSTAIDVDRVISKKSVQGFDLAFNDMIKNLDEELVRFKAQVKEGKSVNISNLKSYSAAGSFNNYFLFLLLPFVYLKRRKLKKENPCHMRNRVGVIQQQTRKLCLIY